MRRECEQRGLDGWRGVFGGEQRNCPNLFKTCPPQQERMLLAPGIGSCPQRECLSVLIGWLADACNQDGRAGGRPARAVERFITRITIILRLPNRGKARARGRIAPFRRLRARGKMKQFRQINGNCGNANLIDIGERWTSAFQDPLSESRVCFRKHGNFLSFISQTAGKWPESVEAATTRAREERPVMAPLLPGQPRRRRGARSKSQ